MALPDATAHAELQHEASATANATPPAEPTPPQPAQPAEEPEATPAHALEASSPQTLPTPPGIFETPPCKRNSSPASEAPTTTAPSQPADREWPWDLRPDLPEQGYSQRQYFGGMGESWWGDSWEAEQYPSNRWFWDGWRNKWVWTYGSRAWTWSSDGSLYDRGWTADSMDTELDQRSPDSIGQALADRRPSAAELAADTEQPTHEPEHPSAPEVPAAPAPLAQVKQESQEPEDDSWRRDNKGKIATPQALYMRFYRSIRSGPAKKNAWFFP